MQLSYLGFKAHMFKLKYQLNRILKICKTRLKSKPELQSLIFPKLFSTCYVIAVCTTLSAIPGFSQTVPSAQVIKDFPSHPIKLVVPYVSGGPMDVIGRLIGQKLQTQLGYGFVLENKGGAGGAIGTDLVAKSAPDGYTVLLTSSSHASLPIIYKNLPYDPINDFTPITLAINSVGFIIAARPDLPAKDLADFIADAKANPNKYTYGSGGIGNVMHFAAESFSSSANVKLVHVPFKGVGQALTELMAGRIDIFIGAANAILPYIKSGKVRALGITANKRWSELPDLQTADEQGLKGFVYAPWSGFWYPAHTPIGYVNKMNSAILKVLEDRGVKQALFDQGFLTVGTSSTEFSKVILSEIAKNEKLATVIDFSEK